MNEWIFLFLFIQDENDASKCNINRNVWQSETTYYFANTNELFLMRTIQVSTPKMIKISLIRRLNSRHPISCISSSSRCRWHGSISWPRLIRPEFPRRDAVGQSDRQSAKSGAATCLYAKMSHKSKCEVELMIKQLLLVSLFLLKTDI